MGKKLGFTADKKNFHNISLGQGQEPVAENAMEVASKTGQWVILQVGLIYFLFLEYLLYLSFFSMSFDFIIRLICNIN